MKDNTDKTLAHWRDQEIMALELLQLAGDLRFKKTVDLLLFRRDIYDTQPSRLISLHSNAKNYSKDALTIDATLALAKAISTIDHLAPARIDLGTLGIEWHENNDEALSINDFVTDRLEDFIGVIPKNKGHKDVILYGFGRIGRLAARRIIETTGKGDQLRLKAIVLRPKLKNRYEEASKRAALLASDSVHGDFGGTIDVGPNGDQLIINGNTVQMIYANHPSDIDYTTYGIDDAIVIDNTGVWRDRDGLSEHLRPGVEKVLLTAPAKGDVPNIVHGVNQFEFDFDKEEVLSAASCTTNAIAPVLKVIHEVCGIDKGHIETVHSYTNDQNLLDNFHKKPRRGRGAPINMVLTSTGAASAIAKVIPPLAGKLSGNAIRVPTPNVSLAILNLTLSKPTTREKVCALINEAALHGDLVEQIQYSNSTEFVSSDAIGQTTACVFDAPSTIVSDDGRTAILYLWYDNEYGYTCQVIRLAKRATNVRRYSYY